MQIQTNSYFISHDKRKLNIFIYRDSYSQLKELCAYLFKDKANGIIPMKKYKYNALRIYYNDIIKNADISAIESALNNLNLKRIYQWNNEELHKQAYNLSYV